MLLTSGTILLLRSTSYPKKYFIWDKAITMAEAVVKPEITEWLMKRRSHPSLETKRIHFRWRDNISHQHKTQVSVKMCLSADTPEGPATAYANSTILSNIKWAGRHSPITRNFCNLLFHLPDKINLSFQICSLDQKPLQFNCLIKFSTLLMTTS